MENQKQSRRAFLETTGSLFGGSWIALNLPAILATADLACQAQQEQSAFNVFSAEEAADLDAMTAQIIPSDDTPGAREARVIYFIDGALATFLAALAEPFQAGLAELKSSVAAAYDGAAFAALEASQQVEVMRGMEETPFFGMVRGLTVIGFLANPSYGGNRDKIGWQLIGFEDRHAWQPPFGYYDAQYTGGQNG